MQAWTLLKPKRCDVLALCTPVFAHEMETASPKVLREWCRASCAGYRDVEVNDWGSSFRSGLAFCAIVHKHRPELIDFSRLSKDNAIQNIKLAFELAETKLGVPMLLQPKEVSAPELDPLAVVTYVSQLYLHFNKKSIGLACVTVSAQKRKSLTHSESTGADSFSATKPRVAACHLCFRPVQLIQRRLVQGKVYHRKCFRCKRCHLSLLPSIEAKGNIIANSLLCSLHTITHRDSVSSSIDTGGYLSLSGLAVSRVPHYPTKTPPLEELVCKDSSDTRSAVKKTSATFPICKNDDGNRCLDEKQEAGVASEENISGVDSERGRRPPVPAPRRRVTSYGTTSSVNMSSSASQGITDRTSGSSPGTTQHGSSSSRGTSRVRQNHPWLNIVQPGIWHQLPPAPPIVPHRAKWYRPKTPAPNPFEEDDNVTKQTNMTEKNQVTEENSEQEQEKEVPEVTEDFNVDRSEESQICAEDSEEQTDVVSTEEAQSHSEAELATVSEDSSREIVSSSPTKVADESSAPDSESSQPPVSLGHGFPLIKRKVQTDLSSPPQDLQAQMGQVHRRLEALEEQGVELERSIRGCSNNKAEEKLLKDWFCLVHQRHELQRKDTELVHLIKQQELEQRQEDVDYELRCLLSKPEEQWTEQERLQEQRLMQQLLSLVEQRNQIISSLDQDAQRERAEDVDWNSTVKNKDVQKRELKELKKSKGKFRTTSVFKILNKKSENQREKKS